MLNEDQIFVIFETELGGKPLEDYKRINFSIAKSILYQVRCSKRSSKFLQTLYSCRFLYNGS